MLIRQEIKTKYFSVHHGMEIDQMRYVPQVCYKVTEDIRVAVEGIERKGLASIYDEEVRFISGVPIAVKKSQKESNRVDILDVYLPSLTKPAIKEDVISIKKKRGKARDFD
jgi:hypothetical protein